MDFAEPALHAQTMLAHRGQMRASRDEAHIAPALSESGAKIAANTSGANDCDSHSVYWDFR
jgi:hypothetical protein